jgi:hypothetical protein
MTALGKRWLLILLALFTGFAGVSFYNGSVSAAAKTKADKVKVRILPIQFFVDDTQYAPPSGQMAFIYKGSTYVPLRFIAYVLDQAVQWDGKTRTVTVRTPAKNEQISISKYKMNAEVRSGDRTQEKPYDLTLTVDRSAVTYLFHGKEKQPPAGLEGMIYKGTLYVPLRFFSESLGRQVHWDPKTFKITATSKSSQPDGAPQPETEAPSEDKPDPKPTVPGGSAKPSYDSIVSEATQQLKQLQNACKQELVNLAAELIVQYKQTSDVSKRAQLIEQGLNKVDECEAKFEQIIQQVSQRLSENGYSLDIISEFRAEFNRQKEQGMGILENMLD